MAAEQLRKYGDGAYRSEVAPLLKMRDDGRVQDRGTKAEVLAEVFVEAATTDKPRRRYVKGMLGRPALFVRKWLGDGIYELTLRLAIR